MKRSGSAGITALYPGSFDPITLGHLDIIERSARLFARVVVALSAESRQKSYSFPTKERLAMIRKVVRPYRNVDVVTFSGLLTRFAHSVGAQVVVRGLRAITDFDYEFQMATMNHNLDPEVETVFMMTSERYSYLSSSIVREIASLGGDISGLVPPAIQDAVIGWFQAPRAVSGPP